MSSTLAPYSFRSMNTTTNQFSTNNDYDNFHGTNGHQPEVSPPGSDYRPAKSKLALEDVLEGNSSSEITEEEDEEKGVATCDETVTQTSTTFSTRNKNFLTNGQYKESTKSLQFAQAPVMVQEIDETQPCLVCHEACPGFRPHGWRKVCANCKCPREIHDVKHRQTVNVFDRLGVKFAYDSNGKTANSMHGISSTVHGYSWVPPGITSQKVEEYMAHLPNNKVPRMSTGGEKYRDKQLMIQLPRQDLASAYCKHLTSIPEQNAFEEFVNNRNEIALDIGYVNPSLEKTMECKKCKGLLEAGEVAVMASKFGANVCWHPSCFVCQCCDELLVDLTYCISRDEKIFCERHFAETIKPRCAACDEVWSALFVDFLTNVPNFTVQISKIT